MKTPMEELKEVADYPPCYGDNVLVISVSEANDIMQAYAQQLQEENDRLKALVGEWVSVEDRLPETSEDVLVGDLESDIVKIGFCLSSDKTWHTDHSTFFEPTHWMPLPQPPQK